MKSVAFVALLLLGGARAFAKPCPAVVGIDSKGSIYNYRGGAWVRQSPTVLEQVLRGGCYPEDGPSPTSSITLELAPNAPRGRIDSVFALFARVGWPKEKIAVAKWTNAPRMPVITAAPR